MRTTREGRHASLLLPHGGALALALGLALLTATPGLAAEPAAIEELSWLAGHWSSDRDGKTTEELWLAPAGGVMVGLNRESTAGREGAFFEYLRIERADGRLQYVASPQGRGATVFPAIEASDRRVVFENPEHDWPQRILYELRGDGTLYVEAGALEAEGRRLSWTHRRHGAQR